MDKRANFRLFENFEKLFRAIVSDNHSANELAYELPLKEFGHLDDNLFIEHDYQKIKNVRNNLLNYKRFIFPAFEYDGFEDPISFKGDQFSWELFHDIFEKDSLLEANVRKAPKMIHKVLHPDNSKKNVQVSFAIFHESSSAALTRYFPEKKNEAEFLNILIYGGLFPILKFSFETTFWTICQKKMMGSRNFVIHLQIGLGIGVMRGSHHLDNSLSPCQLPRL